MTKKSQAAEIDRKIAATIKTDREIKSGLRDRQISEVNMMLGLTGWKKADLVRRARVHPSTISTLYKKSERVLSALKVAHLEAAVQAAGKIWPPIPSVDSDMLGELLEYALISKNEFDFSPSSKEIALACKNVYRRLAESDEKPSLRLVLGELARLGFSRKLRA